MSHSTGIGSPLDPRLHAYRSDLADERLKGRVKAERFVEGAPAVVAVPSAPLFAQPTVGAEMQSELLLGERVRVFENRTNWAWVQSDLDAYVGYVPADALEPASAEPTHRVAGLGTLVQTEPSTKAPVAMDLSHGARVRVVRLVERYAELDEGGFVPRGHLAALGDFEADYVRTAELFLGTPYLWGGRTRLGLDCSGLVQLALQSAGISCPRDSDLQRAALGTSEPLGPDLKGLQRGDLVFWKGHVGLMRDGEQLIHANAFHMRVVVEPLADAVKRIASTGSAIQSVIPARSVMKARSHRRGPV